MKRIVGYTRVSTAEQALSGLSLEYQEDQIRGYAQAKGLTLLEVISDPGESGGKQFQKRAGGKRVQALMSGDEVDGVVAVKLDRLFRNAQDCLSTVDQWDQDGKAFHLVDMAGASIDTSTAMGRFFLTLMAGMAEMEKNLISERTRAALSVKKKRGERTGGIPYGYEVLPGGKKLRVNENEQQIIEHIDKLFSEGISLREICRRLNAEGIPARGKSWHPTSVARIAKRVD